MSRFLDMKEFGDAARYLRLTNLEHLAAKAQAFDGTLMIFNNRFICGLFLKQSPWGLF